MRVVDVVLDGAAYVHLHGKGRKDRSGWSRCGRPLRRPSARG
ncbi:hypothetical protein [Thauera humireducens]